MKTSALVGAVRQGMLPGHPVRQREAPPGHRRGHRGIDGFDRLDSRIIGSDQTKAWRSSRDSRTSPGLGSGIMGTSMRWLTMMVGAFPWLGYPRGRDPGLPPLHWAEIVPSGRNNGSAGQNP